METLYLMMASLICLSLVGMIYIALGFVAYYNDDEISRRSWFISVAIAVVFYIIPGS